jgi:CheY-like chemotaxis protein
MNELNQTPFYKKILVIDDDAVDRYITTRTIKKYAFAKEVITKESAESALLYLKSLADTPEELPNFIFLAIRLPGMDGFDFLEEYKNLPEVIRKKCTIMMLSTSLYRGDLERAKNNKYISKFLNKPLDKMMLREIPLISQTVS